MNVGDLGMYLLRTRALLKILNLPVGRISFLPYQLAVVSYSTFKITLCVQFIGILNRGKERWSIL